jgi:hypothetical protein
MSQHILNKSALDLAAVEGEIQYRLRREKNRLLVSHILCIILSITVIFFVI